MTREVDPPPPQCRSRMNFVIIAPARSGSTLLRQMLNQHAEICCHGEVFGLHRVLGHSVHALHALDKDQALGLRRRDPLKFLHEHVLSSARPVAGFKLLYPQLFHFEFVPVLERLISMPELRVVMLWRRHLIARHVSEVRLRMSADQRQQEQVTERMEAALRPGAVERSCSANLAARACALKLFDRHETLRVEYESLIGDYAAQCAALSSFLGVGAAGWPELPVRAGGPPDPAVARLEKMVPLQAYRDHP